MSYIAFTEETVMPEHFSNPATCCGKQHYTKYCPHCGKQIQVACAKCGKIEPYDRPVCLTHIATIEKRAKNYVQEQLAQQPRSRLERLTKYLLNKMFSGQFSILFYSSVMVLSTIIAIVYLSNTYFPSLPSDLGRILASTLILLFMLLPMALALKYEHRKTHSEKLFRKMYFYNHPNDAGEYALHKTMRRKFAKT